MSQVRGWPWALQQRSTAERYEDPCALQQGLEMWQESGCTGPAEPGALRGLRFPAAPQAGQLVSGDTGQPIPCLLFPYTAAVRKGFARLCLGFPTCEMGLVADGSESCCNPKLSCMLCLLFGRGRGPSWGN